MSNYSICPQQLLLLCLQSLKGMAMEEKGMKNEAFESLTKTILDMWELVEAGEKKAVMPVILGRCWSWVSSQCAVICPSNSAVWKFRQWDNWNQLRRKLGLPAGQIREIKHILWFLRHGFMILLCKHSLLYVWEMACPQQMFLQAAEVMKSTNNEQWQH